MFFQNAFQPALPAGLMRILDINDLLPHNTT
jgi:hypothetical protein